MADSWGGEETQINKLGTIVIIIPALIAASLLAQYFYNNISWVVLCAIAGGFGVLGGAMNVAGRGPIAAGAAVGLVMALGGFGAVYWWIQGKTSVPKLEVPIAFIIGTLPGFALQYGLAKMFGTPAEVEAEE